MSPYERLHRLSSRHGWVPDWEPVLPFALELYDMDDQPSLPVLSGGSEELLTILVTPILYLGPTEDIRAVCHGGWSLAKSREHKDYLYTGNTEGWGEFGRWKEDGAKELLRRLRSIYGSELPGWEEFTLFFYQLNCRIIKAAHDVAVLASDVEDNKI